MDEFKRVREHFVGIGGTKCPCCNPYFGKDREKLSRKTRHRLKQKDRKEFNDAVARTI